METALKQAFQVKDICSKAKDRVEAREKIQAIWPGHDLWLITEHFPAYVALPERSYESKD